LGNLSLVSGEHIRLCHLPAQAGTASLRSLTTRVTEALPRNNVATLQDVSPPSGRPHHSYGPGLTLRPVTERQHGAGHRHRRQPLPPAPCRAATTSSCARTCSFTRCSSRTSAASTRTSTSRPTTWDTRPGSSPRSRAIALFYVTSRTALRLCDPLAAAGAQPGLAATAALQPERRLHRPHELDPRSSQHLAVRLRHRRCVRHHVRHRHRLHPRAQQPRARRASPRISVSLPRQHSDFFISATPRFTGYIAAIVSRFSALYNLRHTAHHRLWDRHQRRPSAAAL